MSASDFPISCDPVTCDTDLNGNGIVNTSDLGLFRTFYSSPPGPSDAGQSNIGLFLTVKKKHMGLGIVKAAVGASFTKGCRDKFDGVDIEASLGLGDFGVSAGGFNPNLPTSVSFDIGLQLGLTADKTQTISFTARDLGRAIARVLHGDGGRIVGED